MTLSREPNHELKRYLRQLFNKTADAHSGLDYEERVSLALIAVYDYGRRCHNAEAARCAREADRIAEMMKKSMTTPSDEALRLAQTPRHDEAREDAENMLQGIGGDEPNLARCYLALRAELEQLSARAIEEVLKREQAEAKAAAYSAKCYHHLAMRQGAESLAERLRAELETARTYASHLEWCRTCAEDSVGSCAEGTALKAAAEKGAKGR